MYRNWHLHVPSRTPEHHPTISSDTSSYRCTSPHASFIHCSVRKCFCSLTIPQIVRNTPNSTFLGIAIHNWSTAGSDGHAGVDGTQGDLASAVRQAAGGILGTSVRAGDLVSRFNFVHSSIKMRMGIWSFETDEMHTSRARLSVCVVLARDCNFPRG